jgi:hypothetical protein
MKTILSILLLLSFNVYANSPELTELQLFNQSIEDHFNIDKHINDTFDIDLHIKEHFKENN